MSYPEIKMEVCHEKNKLNSISDFKKHVLGKYNRFEKWFHDQISKDVCWARGKFRIQALS